jgi:mRNA-degrading endonuclease RelE of RelBE toxin-antitoxin system
MYQVTFSEQALHELSKLDTREQMQLIDPISSLTPTELAHPTEPVGRFNRGDKVFYRLRAGEFRIYFEILNSETLYCEYILHKNTLTDFVFRTKLPVSEEQLLEQHQSFWKYLESLKK